LLAGGSSMELPTHLNVPLGRALQQRGGGGRDSPNEGGIRDIRRSPVRTLAKNV